MSNNCQILWSKLDQLIMKANSILLSTHVHSDGDGIGSEIALYYYLKGLGKECRIINPTKIPNCFKFLDVENKIETYNSDQNSWLLNVDLGIILDVGHFKRIKKISDYIVNTTTVSIDHHPSKNCNFFDLKIIDPKSPATGFMIWQYFCNHQKIKKLDKCTSDALYTAIATDTGFFRHSNTTSESLVVASQLIECGTNPYEIFSQVHERRNHSQVKILAKVIEILEFSNDNRIVWFTITRSILDEYDAGLEDIEGFTDFARSINGVEIAVMFLKVDNTTTRISFRSKGRYSISEIAESLGGGGHPFASGATIAKKDLQEVKLNTIRLIEEKLTTKK